MLVQGKLETEFLLLKKVRAPSVLRDTTVHTDYSKKLTTASLGPPKHTQPCSDEITERTPPGAVNGMRGYRN